MMVGWCWDCPAKETVEGNKKQGEKRGSELLVGSRFSLGFSWLILGEELLVLLLDSDLWEKHVEENDQVRILAGDREIGKFSLLSESPLHFLG
jgi:hypothetical protein